MFGKINSRTQRNIYIILHLIFLTKNCLAFISDKTVDLYPDKYDDIYDDDKLQNNVWMNMFGVYPTLSTNSAKVRLPNVTHEYLPIDKNSENLKLSSNEQDKINAEEKSVEKSKLGNKFESPATNDKTILEMIQDTPLYQLCLRSVNVAETCLALILNSNNLHKIYADKQRICGNLPTWAEFRQCVQQFPFEDESFSKSFEKSMPMAKKNGKIADTPKRLPFHAWGGKRFNQVGTEKVQTSRVPFNAWGGKRAEYEPPYSPYGESCEPCKRSKAKFHSWGGKRSKRKITN